jgi:hypothetical protein
MTIDIGHNGVLVVALVCLTALETVALMQRIDGAYFLPIVAAVCGLVGYKFNAIRSNAAISSFVISKRRRNVTSS